MFCSKCGKQLEDGVRFCNECGAPLSVSDGVANNHFCDNQQNTCLSTETKSTDSKKQVNKSLKNKSNIFIVLAVVLVAFLLGKFVLAPSMTSGNSVGNISSQTVSNTNNSSYPISNSAYNDILANAYIVHMQPMFNMDSMSFVSKLENGVIACADYGYKDDIVKKWVETLYIPVTDLTSAEKDALENDSKSQYAVLEALSCCNVSYKMGTNYFTVTVEYNDVDKKENYSQLFNAGFLNSDTCISMSATESILLNQGAVKK